MFCASAQGVSSVYSINHFPDLRTQDGCKQKPLNTYFSGLFKCLNVVGGKDGDFLGLPCRIAQAAAW